MPVESRSLSKEHVMIKLFTHSILLITMLGSVPACQAQHPKDMKEKNTNPLLCDPEQGICEIPLATTNSSEVNIPASRKPVKIIYFTDPICSSCWGIEPQLRRLKLEYGGDVEIECRMGGLLPDWSYNSGGISKPSDVAHHWDEVSKYYNMPIDGEVWLEDPLASSYPPSIAFKAAQIQDQEKAVKFLRIIREMVFLEKKNITRWNHLSDAATQAGLDTSRLKTDYESQAKLDFQKDLDFARQMSVRGFPTLFMTNATGKQEMVYGFKPYSVFESGLLAVYPEIKKSTYSKDWKSLFGKYPTLTGREFAELSDLPFVEAEQQLEKLVKEDQLLKLVTKNGALWIRKPNREER
jgi:putative protein-disulfide isomerase